ncbi:MAG: hypothetical protein KAU03_02740, partial [Candidatus Altiarchaeales archaeon]|nr:hypothetical protein [Candidatus Altiarchaeales archaeon]
KETNRRLRLDPEERKNVAVASLGYANSSEFIANASNPSNYDDIFSELRAAGIITDAELKNNAGGELSDFLNLTPQGCSSYSPSFGDYTLLGISTKQKGPNKVDMDLDIDCRWRNTVFAELDISLQSSYNCSESWSWGSLADLNTEILAKCLYNWDECFFNPHTIPGYGGTYQEAVDCGMGPPPDLLDTTLKDAARGDKTISFNTVVYRWCGENEKWMSPSAIWACSGDRAWGYPADSNEGNASWVWKCGYEPSLGLTSFVMKKNISTPFDLDTVVPAEEYVCSYVAPHGSGPGMNDYKWEIDNPPNITISRPRLLEYGGMNDDANNTVSFLITDEVDINESSVYVKINGTSWDGYYDIISSTFDGSLHCTNWGL